jgi:hypothetical protein
LDEQKGLPQGEEEVSFEVSPEQIEGIDSGKLKKAHRQSTGYEE